MTNKLEQLAAYLPDEKSAALIEARHHLCYLTGFPSGESYILVTKKGAWFLTDFRYIEMAEQTVKGATCVCFSRMTETLGELIKEQNIARVYLEETTTSLATLALYRRNLPQTEWLTGDELDNWLFTMRAVKDEEEVKKIEAAQALTDDGFAHICRYIKAGMTEREVALELEFYMRKQGAESVAFDFIVVSDPNSSLPHGIPSDKVIEKGNFLTMDFGATLDGYRSDMTRTVAIGSVSDEQRAIYDIVLKAQLNCLAVLRPGLLCTEADDAARSVIAAAGYGDRFGHGTGHGVGVEIHEGPTVSFRAKDQVLKVGNIVTVEPGIYLPSKFGVRIEDMALITETGCRDLTHSPKELILL